MYVSTRGVQFNLLHIECAVKTADCVNHIKSLLQQCAWALIYLLQLVRFNVQQYQDKNAGKPEGTTFCLLKSGSGVSQIQRHHNRDEFDISRMTTYYVKNRNRKQRKYAILNKKKHVVCRRYPQDPDVVKKIRTMIFKTDPATKRGIANLLELNRGSINHVIKHIIKCRVKKKSRKFISILKPGLKNDGKDPGG